MLDQLKGLDAFPRTLDEFRVRTSSGAAVSVMSIVFMLFLFLSEMSYYLNTDLVDHLVVDTSRSRQIRITFDISFPHMPCAVVAVDAQDISGATHVSHCGDVWRLSVLAGGRLP